MPNTNENNKHAKMIERWIPPWKVWIPVPSIASLRPGDLWRVRHGAGFMRDQTDFGKHPFTMALAIQDPHRQPDGKSYTIRSETVTQLSSERPFSRRWSGGLLGVLAQSTESGSPADVSSGYLYISDPESDQLLKYDLTHTRTAYNWTLWGSSSSPDAPALPDMIGYTADPTESSASVFWSSMRELGDELERALFSKGDKDV